MAGGRTSEYFSNQKDQCEGQYYCGNKVLRLVANERARCYPGINVPLSDRGRVRIKCGECVLSGPESDKIGIFKFSSDNPCQPSQYKLVSAVANQRPRQKCQPIRFQYHEKKSLGMFAVTE